MDAGARLCGMDDGGTLRVRCHPRQAGRHAETAERPAGPLAGVGHGVGTASRLGGTRHGHGDAMTLQTRLAKLEARSPARDPGRLFFLLPDLWPAADRAALETL